MGSVISQDRLNVLADTAKMVAHLPGHLAELGVYEGGSAKVIAEACLSKRMYLYDTFTGIPEDDRDTRGSHTRGSHKKGDFATDIELVKNNLRGLNVVFRPGLFPGTAVDCRYAFVHLDADTWQSTVAGITYFWPRLVVGGYLILDDYGRESCPGVKRAVTQHLYGHKFEVTGDCQIRFQRPVYNF